MKTRMFSAVIGLSLLGFVMFFYETLILNFAVSILCSFMVYEIFRATKMIEKAWFMFFSAIFYSSIFPFSKIEGFGDYRIGVISIYILLNVFFLLKQSSSIKVYDVFFCSVSSVVITLFTSNIIYIRNNFYPHGIYYIILFFLIPWVCDAGAYFIGIKFGRTKLAPKISPKKTLEGAFGGLVFTFFIVLAYTKIFVLYFSSNARVNIYILFFVTFLGSVLSIVGDLTMSVFKRQHQIKDFGNIIQGHGGVLDRFDSWIFVSAVLYPIIKAFPIIIY